MSTESPKRHLNVAPPDPPVGGPIPEEELLQVGDLARATGKTVRALHLYEDMGLLKPHERSARGRYRLFSNDALARVRWVAKLQYLGLPLSEIQSIAKQQADADSAQFAAERLREVYVTKLEETRAKVRELTALEAELEASLEFLDVCHSACEPATAVESCDCCARHTEKLEAPELVAGVRSQ